MDKTLTFTLSRQNEDDVRKISQFYGEKACGRAFNIVIDPNIIGGFIITDGDISLDYSAKGQLDAIKRMLKKENVVGGVKP